MSMRKSKFWLLAFLVIAAVVVASAFLWLSRSRAIGSGGTEAWMQFQRALSPAAQYREMAHFGQISNYSPKVLWHSWTFKRSQVAFFRTLTPKQFASTRQPGGLPFKQLEKRQQNLMRRWMHDDALVRYLPLIASSSIRTKRVTTGRHYGLHQWYWDYAKAYGSRDFISGVIGVDHR
jgi:hypothetical protein